jgi:CRP-like cAMP-binding protein
MVDLEKIKQLYNFSRQLSFSDANELISAAESNSFTKKEIIIGESSKKNTVYFVRSGMIRKYFINEKGEEITFGLIPENYIVANVDVILFDQASRFYYEAIEKTKTFSIDYDVIQEIFKSNPRLESNRKKFFQQIMREAHLRIEGFILYTPEERYIKFIEKYPDINNRVPDKYIANVLGITPVSLSRIRARIIEKPITEKY